MTAKRREMREQPNLVQRAIKSGEANTPAGAMANKGEKQMEEILKKEMHNEAENNHEQENNLEQLIDVMNEFILWMEGDNNKSEIEERLKAVDNDATKLKEELGKILSEQKELSAGFEDDIRQIEEWESRI
jgi:hypothetical protein